MKTTVMATLHLYILLFGMVRFAESYRTGAPIAACSTMRPNHGGIEPQVGPSPYTVRTSRSHLEYGQRLEIILDSHPSLDFAGFLVQAHSINEHETALPTFYISPEVGQILSCGAGPQNAVTHKDNTRKKSVMFEWEPSADFTGPIIFNATVVYNYTTFWIDVASGIIEVVRSDSEPSGLDPKLGAFNAMYRGCDDKKICFGFPPNCVTEQKCDFFTTAMAKEDDYVFELGGRTNGSEYVAVALSDDAIMGQDSVVECAAGIYGVNIFMSWNEGKSNQPLPRDGVQFINGSLNDGQLYCKFMRKAVTTINGKEFDLKNNKYHFLIASGPISQAGTISYHNSNRASSGPVTFPAAVADKPVTDKPFQDTLNSMYIGCNVEKTCFGFPPNCESDQKCDFLTTVMERGDHYVFELGGRIDDDDKYVAVGLSEDEMMGDDSVVECTLGKTGINAMDIFMSWNEGRNNFGLILQDGVQLINRSFVDGQLYCKFIRKAVTSVYGKEFDLKNNNYHFLIASGPLNKDGSLSYHNSNRASSRTIALGAVADEMEPTENGLGNIYDDLMLKLLISVVTFGYFLV